MICMKILRNVCRLLIGIIFIYSGFVKGIDPLGTTYKLNDYFNAFSLDWISSASLVFSMLLSALEFIIGICLIINVKIKWSSIGALAFMSIFTPLTLFIALSNPVSDCGCFGDAFIVTNWETFFKNIILLAAAIITFKEKNNYKTDCTKTEEYFWLIASTIFILGVSIYSYKHLPLLDFRPYKTGVNITEAMNIPEGEATDEYRSIFKYKNIVTNEIKEFNENNYPWQDTTTWEYVDIRQEIIKEGYHPSINDFTLIHPYNGDISEEILNNQGYSFLLISYNINNYDNSNQENINKLAAFCQENGHVFYCVSSSLEEDLQKFTSDNNIDYEFCNMDETQLKTIIRSNPGLLLLKNGTIIKKWHNNDIPDIDEFRNRDILSYCIQENKQSKDKKTILIIGLIWLLALLSFRIIKFKKTHINN